MKTVRKKDTWSRLREDPKETGFPPQNSKILRVLCQFSHTWVIAQATVSGPKNNAEILSCGQGDFKKLVAGCEHYACVGSGRVNPGLQSGVGGGRLDPFPPPEGGSDPHSHCAKKNLGPLKKGPKSGFHALFEKSLKNIHQNISSSLAQIAGKLCGVSVVSPPPGLAPPAPPPGKTTAHLKTWVGVTPHPFKCPVSQWCAMPK